MRLQGTAIVVALAALGLVTLDQLALSRRGAQWS